ncbi:uncharacterized protein SPSK_02768 [Sporothrix schenckii 1099-18]|uniref:Ig-like domain-containing protein n=1 Tax=Sporothrix schenckii 1099-18 TaxID=1397361 RepID=A0A0F2MDC2_SPOSC|nr:uncharacterized protein SPSK_02768 [Sporothrix schenckii 1099-18]KJR86136.1 hypothetical protein SPSK_02768 [Sporothrix schenckii 1099-18]
MRFPSILVLGSLLWAGAVAASQCKPSHTPSSSSISPSSVSSSSAAASSSSPPHLPPCYTNLLGSRYKPTDVASSQNIAESYPVACPIGGGNTCVRFLDTDGQAGSFSFSATVPTVPGTYYAYYAFVRIAAADSSNPLVCTVTNSASTTSQALQTGDHPVLLDFLAGPGSSSTVTCSGSVQTTLDLTASALSIISTDPSKGCA